MAVKYTWSRNMILALDHFCEHLKIVCNKKRRLLCVYACMCICTSACTRSLRPLVHGILMAGYIRICICRCVCMRIHLACRDKVLSELKTNGLLELMHGGGCGR
jgi:hypothetical protein